MKRSSRGRRRGTSSKSPPRGGSAPARFPLGIPLHDDLLEHISQKAERLQDEGVLVLEVPVDGPGGHVGALGPPPPSGRRESRAPPQGPGLPGSRRCVSPPCPTRPSPPIDARRNEHSFQNAPKRNPCQAPPPAISSTMVRKIPSLLSKRWWNAPSRRPPRGRSRGRRADVPLFGEEPGRGRQVGGAPLRVPHGIPPSPADRVSTRSVMRS